MGGTVSVIIPAFRARTFIEEAIKSVQAQTYPVQEIIVVDDASDDGTADIVARLAENDTRVKLIRLSKNIGPAGARNEGIGAATGEWLALLDADDRYLKERVAVLLSEAEHNEADAIADNLQLFDEGAARVVEQTEFCHGLERLTATALFERDIPDKNKHPIGWIKPIFRAAFLRTHGITYNEALRYAEDFIFVAEVLLSGGKVLITPAAEYVYTMPRGSVSGKTSSMTRTTVPESRTIAAQERRDYLIEKYGSKMSDEARAALWRRTEATTIFEQRERTRAEVSAVIAATRRGAVIEAATRCLSRPAVLGHLVEMTAKKLLARD